MAVFEKARALCKEFDTVDDFDRSMAEQEALVRRALASLNDPHPGPAAKSLRHETLEKGAAMGLLVLASQSAATRLSTDVRQFDKTQVRAELERLESLVFDNWEHTDVPSWYKRFDTVADRALTEKAIRFLGQGHDHPIGVAAQDKILVMEEKGMDLLEAVRQSEQGRKY